MNNTSASYSKFTV